MAKKCLLKNEHVDLQVINLKARYQSMISLNKGSQYTSLVAILNSLINSKHKYHVRVQLITTLNTSYQ